MRISPSTLYYVVILVLWEHPIRMGIDSCVRVDDVSARERVYVHVVEFHRVYPVIRPSLQVADYFVLVVPC